MPPYKYEESKRAVNIDGIVAAVKEVMVEKKAVRLFAAAQKIVRITLTGYISKPTFKCSDCRIGQFSYQ